MENLKLVEKNREITLSNKQINYLKNNLNRNNRNVKYFSNNKNLLNQSKQIIFKNILNLNKEEIINNKEYNDLKILLYLIFINTKESLEILIKIIEEKRKEIFFWNKKYYEENESVVDDLIFDNSINELQELEEIFPFLINKNSPTKNVGSLTTTPFKKQKHKFSSMLSLKNAFNNEDLIHFENQIKGIFVDKKIIYFVEPKIDGLSISLNYKNGKIISAITRGNGIIGENVLENVLEIESIPKNININDELEIRGEIYIDIDEFERINNERILKNEEIIKNGNKPLTIFSNPRNLASGTLRQLDKSVIKSRNLKSFFFSAISKDGHYWKTQEETITNLKKNKFSVNNLSKKANKINEVFEIIEKISSIRKKLKYEIDGVVVKINDYNLYDKIGETSKFPKWAIAYKFPSEIKSTKLNDIFPTVGRTGRITYNASLEEVEILGTKVRKATLHNSNYIKSLNINVGDYVNIKKAGDIIPKVISLKEKINNDEWEEIHNCPSCNQKLIRFDNEVDQYCVNYNCPSKQVEKIIHFVSRKALNIDGFSKQQIKKFYNLNLLKNINDIFELKNKKKELLKLDGYQEKSINNLLNSIEKSKQSSLEKWLFAFGIRHIGEKTSLDLSKKFKKIENIMNANYDDIINDYDFGEVKVKSLIEWVKNEENIKLIEELKKKGIDFSINQDLQKENIDSDLKGKNVIFTGKLDNFTRDEVKEHLLKLGANYKSSISNNLDFVFVGKNPSKNKLSKINDNNKIIYVNDLKDIK